MAEFNIKFGDTGPPLEAALTDQTGAAVNLTGATVTARFSGGISRTCAIVGPAAAGNVRYDFGNGDWVDGGFLPGLLSFDFVILFPGGERMTAPTVGHKTIEIHPSF